MKWLCIVLKRSESIAERLQEVILETKAARTKNAEFYVLFSFIFD